MKIACLLITHNRPDWVRWAIWQFGRQSHPDRHLFVLDSSKPKTAMAVDGRLVSIRQAPQAAVAEKRNQVMAWARFLKFEVACWWEDDSFYPSWHLAASLAAKRGWAVAPRDIFRVDTQSWRAGRVTEVPLSGLVFDLATAPKFGYHPAGERWTAGVPIGRSPSAVSVLRPGDGAGREIDWKSPPSAAGWVAFPTHLPIPTP